MSMFPALQYTGQDGFQTSVSAYSGIRRVNQRTVFEKVIINTAENNPRGLHFSKALFQRLIFGGAYIRRGLSTAGNLRFKIDCASLIVGSKFTVFALFYFVFEGNFPSTSPWGGLYLEGRFNGGFFALPVWRGLFLEGLIHGGAYFDILRYATFECFMEQSTE